MTLNSWLYVGSCIYLGVVVTLILGILEFDEWQPIWRSTLRRWLKLTGALIIIGVAVLLLGL